MMNLLQDLEMIADSFQVSNPSLVRRSVNIMLIRRLWLITSSVMSQKESVLDPMPVIWSIATRVGIVSCYSKGLHW